MWFRADVTCGLGVFLIPLSQGIGIRKTLRLVTMIWQDLDMDTSPSTMDAP